MFVFYTMKDSDLVNCPMGYYLCHAETHRIDLRIEFLNILYTVGSIFMKKYNSFSLLMEIYLQYFPRSLGVQFQNYLPQVLPAILDGMVLSISGKMSVISVYSLKQ